VQREKKTDRGTGPKINLKTYWFLLNWMNERYLMKTSESRRRGERGEKRVREKTRGCRLCAIFCISSGGGQDRRLIKVIQSHREPLEEGKNIPWGEILALQKPRGTGELIKRAPRSNRGSLRTWGRRGGKWETTKHFPRRTTESWDPGVGCSCSTQTIRPSAPGILTAKAAGKRGKR